MIADPNDGTPRCGWCQHLDQCPTPQACERAEEDRIRRRGWRDFTLAAALIAVVLFTLWRIS